MWQVLGMNVLGEIASCLQNTEFVSIVGDETSDPSNQKQLVISIRWIDDILVVREDVIGLRKLERADASTITDLIKDSLIRINLSINEVR